MEWILIPIVVLGIVRFIRAYRACVRDWEGLGREKARAREGFVYVSKLPFSSSAFYALRRTLMIPELRHLSPRLAPPWSKPEKWLFSLSLWIPRKYREGIIGDILEDCREMRRKRFSKRRIRVHILWQLTIAVIALWPESVGSAVAAILKRVWSIRRN
jgi:hypothetical protein